MKNEIKIIKSIINSIKEEPIGDPTETYELFRVVDAIAHLLTLEDINIKQRQALLVSMALAYVNIGCLYAKNNLSETEYKNFRMWIQIQIDKDYLEEFGCYLVNVCYTRNADFCQRGNSLKQIPWTDCDIFPLIKDVQGLSGFDCMEEQFEDMYGEQTSYYHLFPKSIDGQTTRSQYHSDPDRRYHVKGGVTSIEKK